MKPAIPLLLAAFAAFAQVSPTPRYEVASIKPNTGVTPFTFRIEPDGALSTSGITLKRLMMTAYNVQDFRIVGGPDWVSSRRWDVQAKPEHAAASIDEIHQMLRTLLEDRFQLRVRAESRNLPLYELVIDSKGSKVPRPKNPAAQQTIDGAAGFLRMTRTTSATFASQLSYSLARPVTDNTGLSGQFDFVLHWTPQLDDRNPGAPAEPAPPPDGPDIFTAIREQLGLRLQAGRGPVDVIVIDKAEFPSPN
jgi:uncharacterized protein (TIGR03435 family)